MNKLIFALVLSWFLTLTATAETISSGGFEYSIEATPNWVKATDVPQNAPDESLGLTFELFSSQLRLVENEHRFYRRTVHTVRSEQGLQEGAKLSLYFVPDFQQLYIHNIRLIRDGKSENILDRANIRLIQEESELNMGIISGQVMALILLPDVRVGDQIDYDYSVEGTNSIYGEKRFSSFTTTLMVPLGLSHVYVQSDRALRHRMQKTPGELVVRQEDTLHHYEWSQSNTEAIEDEGEYPGWYNPYGLIEFTEYQSWAEVSDWAATLFEYGIDLPEELKALSAKWQSETSTPLEYAEKVVDFVQNDIRYVGLLLGQNTHKPNNPLDILQRRYGDCKDKAYMIALLLREAGIDAYAALVSFYLGRGVEDYMPTPGVFDHVISVFYIDGQEFWVDGTRTFQKTPVDNRSVSDFQKALVIDTSIKDFNQVTPPQHHVKSRELHEVLVASSYDEPVEMSLSVVFQGAEAEDMRAYIASDGVKAFEKDLLNYFLRIYPNLESVTGLSVEDDNQQNRLLLSGDYRIPNYFDLSESQLQISLYGENISGITSLPSIKDRRMPLALYNGYMAKHSIEFNLPDSIEWELDTAPFTIEDENTRYSRTMQASPQRISVMHEYEIKRDHVPTEKVADYISNLHEIRDSLYFSVMVQNDSQQRAEKDQLRSRLRDALKRR